MCRVTLEPSVTRSLARACDTRDTRRSWRRRTDRIAGRTRSARPAIDSSSLGRTQTPLARRTEASRPGTERRESPCLERRRTAPPSTRLGTWTAGARRRSSARNDPLSITNAIPSSSPQHAPSVTEKGSRDKRSVTLANASPGGVLSPFS